MRVKPILVLLLAGAAFASVSAPAHAQVYLGVASGLYQPEAGDQPRTEDFGLRGGYRLRPSFGFEWNLSRVELADTVPFQDNPTVPGVDFDKVKLQLELYNLDLSVQWFPRAGNVVIFGGPGVSMLDSKLIVTFLGATGEDPDNTNILTGHAGVAYLWQTKGHFFIRPEFRARHYFGYEVTKRDRIQGFYYSYEGTDYETGVTFGWRLGK
jgi:Outer membrane protein beta-barrel domain